jgi:large subunit ribosomal protein L13
MKTRSIKLSEINHQWWIADADGQVLGRFASRIAQILRGKHKPSFTPHMDMGDCVVVINAEKIRVTGKKETDKEYFKHSGYPGSKSFKNVKLIRKTNPERIVQNAVKGMLPHNRLGRKINTHLKVYAGSEHPHQAQNPKKLEF